MSQIIQAEGCSATQPDVSAVTDLKTGAIVHVTVTGSTGSGKSAICGLIVHALRSASVPVHWAAGAMDEDMIDHAEYRSRALLMYQPSVSLREVNLSRAPKAAQERTVEELANDLFWLSLEPRLAKDEGLLTAVAARLESERRKVTARNEQIEELEGKLSEAVSACDTLQAQVDAFHNDRLYVLGCNAGYEAAEEHAKFDLGGMSEELIELREDRVLLLEAIEAAIVKIRGFAGADESDVEFLKKALGQPQDVDEVEDVALRTAAQVRDDAIKAAYAPGPDEPEERRKSLAIIHFERLVTIRLVLEALETKFGSRAIGKTNVCAAMLDTVEFMQGSEFVRPRAEREKPVRPGLTADVVAAIKDAALGVRS